uniref:Ubiquitin-like domain-containing protein n=1 Tax=Glossina pallidipes TaxID=7398 RepID=A0A1A9ZJZ5_GLOPL
MDKPTESPTTATPTSLLPGSTTVASSTVDSNGSNDCSKSDVGTVANQVASLNDGNGHVTSSIHTTNDANQLQHNNKKTSNDCILQNLTNVGCGPSVNATTATSATNCNNKKIVSANLNYSASAANVSTKSPCTAIENYRINNSTKSAAASIASATVQARNILNSAASLSMIRQHRNQTSQLAPINLNINTTTGNNFSVTVDPFISVESLKKTISKKLKLVKDRICLLHRESFYIKTEFSKNAKIHAC